MKVSAIVIVSAGLLAGCEAGIPIWDRAGYSYSCTEEQHKKVEVEAAWCKSNTKFTDTYCYGAAIMRNCQKKEPCK